MTGLDVNRHEIIEIAALVVSQPDLVVRQSYYTKVLPQHIQTANRKSLEVVGYSAQKWQDAIVLRQTLVDLTSLAPDCIIAGWSVQNEWDFLLAALEKEGLPTFFSNYLLEVSTLAFAKLRLHPGLFGLGLGRVCRLLGISIQRHQPDSDIRATYEIFRRLVD